MIAAPRWGQAWSLALLAAFVAGAAAGAFGWSERTHAPEPVGGEVVVGGISVQGRNVDETGNAVYDVTANLFNLNDRDLTVVEARYTGWVTLGDQPRTTLPARRWAAVALTLTPDCSVRPAQRLLLRLEPGAQRAVLPVRPQASDTHGLHSLVCSGRAPGVRVMTEALEIATDDTDGGTLEMRIPLRATAGAGSDEITLTDLDASTAGYRGTAVGLPVEMRPGHTETVTVRWSVEDCAATDRLGDVELTARTATADTLLHPLPARAVAALARLGADECPR